MNNLLDSEPPTGRKWAKKKKKKNKGSVNHELVMVLDFENSGWMRRELIIFF